MNRRLSLLSLALFCFPLAAGCPGTPSVDSGTGMDSGSDTPMADDAPIANDAPTANDTRSSDDVAAADDTPTADAPATDDAPIEDAAVPAPDTRNPCETVRCSAGFECCPLTGMCFDTRCLSCCMGGGAP